MRCTIEGARPPLPAIRKGDIVAVQVWIGEKPDNPNERKAIIALANGLDRLEGLYVMIANFSVGGRAVDLVILKSDGIFILELKHCDGKVFGDVNGRWKVVSKSGSTKWLNPGRKNPYGQVMSYFYNFTNFLNDHKAEIVGAQRAQDIDFRSAKRVIVIVPTIEEGSRIDLDWKVQAKGLDELPTYLVTERSAGIELSDEELLRIPKLLHCEPWRELNDLIAGVLPAWEATPSEAVVPPPMPKPQPVAPPAPQPAPQRGGWQAALRRALTWPGTMVYVFVLLAVLLTIAIIPRVLPEIVPRDQPVTAAQTVQPIPTIPPIGIGENVSNGIADIRQQVGRRWDYRAQRWLLTDAENADVLVTLETVDFNNGRIKLDWTVENQRRVPIRMALVPENIAISDNQMKYLIDPQLSDPPGALTVEPGQKRTATVIVPQAVRANAITLQITLLLEPFGETSWIVNVPQ